MSGVDPRLVAALEEQAARRPSGGRVIGRKIGAGERESIGGELAVGYLTAATMLEAGATYDRGGVDLHADVEVALELGEDEAISGYGVALEIVDLGDDGDAAEIVASNIFHRAVAFGPFAAAPPLGATARALVDGEERDAAPVADDFDAKLAAVVRLLGATRESLRPGDRIITGSVVQVPIASGDVVSAEIGALGTVTLEIA